MIKKIALAIACIAIIATGVVFWLQDTKADKSLSKQETVKETEQLQKKYFAVYRVDKNNDVLVREIYEQPKTDNIDLLQVSMETLIKTSPQKDGLINLFPERLKILNVKKIGSLVQVDFSKDLLQKKVGGSMNEILLVGSIVNTLTELPGVDSVQILVEGKKIETISGHLDLTDPIKRNESIIKK